jgi:chromosome segregation ATPase
MTEKKSLSMTLIESHEKIESAEVEISRLRAQLSAAQAERDELRSDKQKWFLLSDHTSAAARIDQLEAVVRDVECLMSAIEKVVNHKREWLALLAKARVALGMTTTLKEQS